MPFIGNKPSAVPLTSADIADSIITSAKIVDATITNSDVASSIITGQTAETSIAGGDSVLIYDDSAAALRKMTRTNFVSGVGATNTPAFLSTRESSQTISDSTTTKLQFSTEVFDTDSCYDPTTNYRFTPTKAGKYLFFCKFMLQNTAEPVQVLCTFQKNGSTTYEGFRQTANGSEVDVTCHQILEANGTTDYFEAFVFHQAGANRSVYGNTEQRTHFGGFFITT